ncbi:Ribosome biogenesis protein ERB1 [Bienertia sinuspersici]
MDNQRWEHEIIDNYFASDVAGEIKKIQLPLFTTKDDKFCKNLWSSIWKANIPTKIRNFSWRACKESLPVICNMVKRGMEVEIRCPLERCGIFRPYDSIAKNIMSLPFRRGLVVGHILGSSLDIWFNRNSWLFERKKKDINYIIHRAINQVNEVEWANASTKKMKKGKNSDVRWKLPMERLYKRNTYATLVNENVYGLGEILRDHVGDL